jgi:hypothetical protein
MAQYQGSGVYLFRINNEKGYREIRLTVKELEEIVDDMIETLYESSNESELLYNLTKELKDSMARRFIILEPEINKNEK